MVKGVLRWVIVIGLAFSLFNCGDQLPPGDADNGGLVVPDGFEVVVVADSIGSARHMAVSDNGDIYVKLRGGKPKGIVALRDVNKDGKVDTIKYFGDYEDKGNYGTAMRIHNGYMYFSTAGEVYRFKMTPGQLVPDGEVELIVLDEYKKDMHGYEHIAKPIALVNTLAPNWKIMVAFGSLMRTNQIRHNSEMENFTPQASEASLPWIGTSRITHFTWQFMDETISTPEMLRFIHGGKVPCTLRKNFCAWKKVQTQDGPIIIMTRTRANG
jgi:hypothetical protein